MHIGGQTYRKQIFLRETTAGVNTNLNFIHMVKIFTKREVQRDREKKLKIRI
jgi:hypothetical protein